VTGRKSGKQLDRFDRDLLAFMLSWAPYGGPPENECFVEFGMSTDRVRERCMEVVCGARPVEYRDTDCSMILRCSRLLLAPVQRDNRSAAPVARPRVTRFARLAVSTTFHPAIDAEASLRSGGNRLGDAAIDLKPGLSAAGDDTPNGRHGDVENHVAERQIRPGPVRLR